MHPAWRDGLAGLDRDRDLAPLLFQTPVRRIPVDISSAPRLLLELDPEERTAIALVAKLGAKSWRDGGFLRVINEDRLIASALSQLLDGITPHQARYLDCIRPHIAEIELASSSMSISAASARRDGTYAQGEHGARASAGAACPTSCSPMRRIK
jgi:hypothetical protein